MDITSILLEGGTTLIQSAMRANLVDKVHVYVAPKILGDINKLAGLLSTNPSRCKNLKKLRNEDTLRERVRGFNFLVRNSPKIVVIINNQFS